MKSIVSLTAGIILLSTLASAQADVEAKAAENTNKLVKMHLGWSKLSTAGASVEIKEVLRDQSSGRLRVQYHLYVKGLLQDDLYQYLNWPINKNGPEIALNGISIGKDGLLMCAGRASEQCGDPAKKDDPIEFTFFPARGEPYRVGVQGEEHSDVRLTTVIVPDPIESKDKGCRLSVIRLLPNFELAWVQGEGFPANTAVSMDASSYKESHVLSPTTNESGHFEFAVLPGVAGHKNGTTRLKTLSGICLPSVSFDWGN